jgi:hypothetical protein
MDWDHDSVAPSPDDDHPQQTSEKSKVSGRLAYF